MNILVTGSTGFIGGALCRALVEQGHTVRAFHRAGSSLRLIEDLPVEHAVGDLTQPATLTPAMDGIEAVFHAAAWMSNNELGRLYAVTVEGTRAVLRAARQAGVRRLVHTSSVAALGVPPPGQVVLMDETHTWNLRPEQYPYGYAKYLAELEVQKEVALGLDAVIVNPALVVGPGDVHRGSTSILLKVARGKVGVSMAGGLNVVHLRDVIAGHLKALESGRTGERYILGGQNLTHTEFLKTLARVSHAPANFVELPAGLVRAFRLPAQWLEHFIDLPVSADLFALAGRTLFCDTSKARAELNLPEPLSCEQAAAEAYAWFQEKSTR